MEFYLVLVAIIVALIIAQALLRSMRGGHNYVEIHRTISEDGMLPEYLRKALEAENIRYRAAFKPHLGNPFMNVSSNMQVGLEVHRDDEARARSILLQMANDSRRTGS